MSATWQRERIRTLLGGLVKDLTRHLDVSTDQAIAIDKGIVKFSGLGSLDNLKRHHGQRKLELGSLARNWSKSLVEKLGGLTSVPSAAGLGALVIAVIIDLAFAVTPGDSTADVLRRTFAEEKASDVWDHVDECIKRYTIHIKNEAEQKRDIKRIERQLSAALTRLKNSMQRDGQMTQRALKVWVNGAAFHVQMLIHLARMEGSLTCDPVESLLAMYQRDVDILFRQHKELKQKQCSLKPPLIFVGYTPYKIFHDEGDDYKYTFIYTDVCPTAQDVFDAYYDHRFTGKKNEIEVHFAEVRKNLQALIGQKGSFTP